MCPPPFSLSLLWVSFTRTIVIGFRAHRRIQDDLILRVLIAPVETFSKGDHVHGFWGLGCGHIFREAVIHPPTPCKVARPRRGLKRLWALGQSSWEPIPTCGQQDKPRLHREPVFPSIPSITKGLFANMAPSLFSSVTSPVSGKQGLSGTQPGREDLLTSWGDRSVLFTYTALKEEAFLFQRRGSGLLLAPKV